MARATPLIAGNWKMNGTSAALDELRALAEALDEGAPSAAEILVCPPATLLFRAAQVLDSTGIALGGQDCHPAAEGAHTGDISAEMIADAGGRYVIVGHSERRADHGESDALIAAKVAAARRAGLVPVVCVGETGDERDAGRAMDVVAGQLAGSIPDEMGDTPLVVAYEPVWAIGTGRTPSVADIADMHAGIRRLLAERFGAKGEAARILYGGSVKPSNAAEILAIADVDGALVGGASLKAQDFYAIITASM